MGVNFSPLEIGRRALQANQLGITVAGQNIANVNTPGYARQSVQLSATPGDGSNLRLVGTGVTIDGVRSFRDRFIESRLQTETAISGRLTARRDVLAPVDAAFNESDDSPGINSAMNNFFGAFRELEAQPSSVSLRTSVVEKGAALANTFNVMRSRLVGIRQDADASLRATVGQANELAQQMADLNVRISVAEHSGGSASELRDQRGEVMNHLAALTGARAVENEQGMLTLSLADGRTLVSGDRVISLEAVTTMPDGLATITLGGSAADIGDGRLRGLLDSIGDIGGHIEALDELASGIVERVNTLHASGTNLDGSAGGEFFALPSNGASVTAASIAVNPALKVNPRLVVASPLSAPSGAGTLAGAIANLLTDPSSQVGAQTGSFSAVYASMVADAGAGVAHTENALATQQSILSQVNAQRDAVSGVSLDEEAINLLQYQRAYEAAARFLKIADEMTQTILSLGQ